ncbi:DNA-binding transcriptional LysR family regulator [Providencia alcalifaciens]|nr:DNA-binding transcriptional LysR family regulator [Providencia alcalifaciens]
MPAVSEKFKQRAPKIRLSLQSLNCYVIRDALLTDNADLGIFYRVGHDNAFAMENLGTQRLVLVASPKIENINFTQHNQQLSVSFIINEPQCIFRQIFEITTRQRNITFENTIELWTIKSIKLCVSCNLGVSFLPYFTVCSAQLNQDTFLKEFCSYSIGDRSPLAV